MCSDPIRNSEPHKLICFATFVTCRQLADNPFSFLDSIAALESQPVHTGPQYIPKEFYPSG
jgi:hypothetical protein